MTKTSKPAGHAQKKQATLANGSYSYELHVMQVSVSVLGQRDSLLQRKYFGISFLNHLHIERFDKLLEASFSFLGFDSIFEMSH